MIPPVINPSAFEELSQERSLPRLDVELVAEMMLIAIGDIPATRNACSKTAGSTTETGSSKAKTPITTASPVNRMNRSRLLRKRSPSDPQKELPNSSPSHIELVLRLIIIG
jgi:hypothetical protein